MQSLFETNVSVCYSFVLSGMRHRVSARKISMEVLEANVMKKKVFITKDQWQ